MANPWGAARVAFDFDGALDLARKMWALAEDLEAVDAKRSGAADVASAKWRGRYANEFEVRVQDEASSTRSISSTLRAEAKGWANAWAKAMNEQNRRNRAARVAEERAARSWWERNVGDRILGDDTDEQVGPVQQAKVPSPPQFHPTMTEQAFR